MKDEYPTGKADLMTAFMLKSQALAKPGGTWGMINLPSWMSLKSFENLRHDLLRDQRISSMVHLGRGIFGSDFGSVAFVVVNAKGGTGRAVYRRLFEQHVDVRSVDTIEELFLDRNYKHFVVSQSDFKAIPGSPIVYWLSEKMRISFATGRPLSEVANVRQGLATADNDRFLRQWWEVAATRTAFSCTSREEAAVSDRRWFPYNKGGDFRRWYGNHEHVVNWEQDGAEIRAFGTEKGGKPRSRPQNTHTYFSPSVSWSAITSGNPSFRYYPHGFIPSNAGMACYASDAMLKIIISVVNSAVAENFLSAIAPTMNLGAGETSRVPMPLLSEGESQGRVDLLIGNSSMDWSSAETSWDFVENPLVSSWRSGAREKSLLVG